MQQSKWATGGQDAPLDYGESFNRQCYGDMVVCTFYQRGQCKFGDNCKNEHPGSQRDANRGFGNYGGSNANRFNAFRGGGDSYRPAQQSGGAFGGGRDARGPRFHLDREDIKADLTSQRPIFPISCYGPGRDAPRQLIEGPVEVSPEELRSRYYSQRLSGNEAAAVQEETQLGGKMQEQVQNILNDLNGAIKYVEEGADVHPNRHDIAEGKAPAPSNAPTESAVSNPFSKPPANPFGGGSQTQTSAFGQTSTPAFGQTSASAFARPALTAFGQPSNPAQNSSAFGQTTALGGGSAFGKPSAPGPTPFGQPSALGGGSAFGKPSLPGAGSAFGQSSALGQQSAFGQPSAPGTTSGFGKHSMPGQASGFGQSSALGQGSAFGKPGFGQSGFGQTSQPGAAPSPFSQQSQTQQTTQPSPFSGQAQQANQPSPFSQPAQQANPFGKPQQKPTPAQPNPFGGSNASQPSAFGQPGFGKSPAFPAQSQPAAVQSANPFAQKSQSPTAAATAPFGDQAQQPSPFSQPPQQAAPSPFAQQGQSATTPAAALGASKSIDPKDRFKEGRPEDYEGEQGKKLEEVYKRVAQTGRFNEDEEIPVIPPKCEWIVPVH